MFGFIKKLLCGFDKDDRSEQQREVSPEEREEFCKRLKEHTRETRKLVLVNGDAEPTPETKISGTPWWPQGIPRPVCSSGHLMSFVMQVRLSDVPGLEKKENSLLSFHYCDECALEGKMAFGGFYEESDGFNVSIFHDTEAGVADGLGMVSDSIVEPYKVDFTTRQEVPSYIDTFEMFAEYPDDYPQGDDDYDENIYPGVIHIADAKLGGWPSWVQPSQYPDENSKFIAQLDWQLCPDTPWCNGYAYLFLKEDGSSDLVIQTT